MIWLPNLLSFLAYLTLAQIQAVSMLRKVKIIKHSGCLPRKYCWHTETNFWLITGFRWGFTWACLLNFNHNHYYLNSSNYVWIDLFHSLVLAFGLKTGKTHTKSRQGKQTRKQFIGFSSWTSYKQLYCLRNSLNVVTYTSNDAYVIITNYLNQLSSLPVIIIHPKSK